MTPFLKKIQAGENFSQSELTEIFSSIIEGKCNDIQVASFLFALSLKGESSDEIFTLVDILKRKSKSFIAPTDTIDVCGTGGDGKNSLNISTAVAFVVAACGIPVAKHGNRSVSSLSGSSDVLQELGVNINASKEVMEQALLKYNIAFLFAPNYHNALTNIAPIRKLLGVRTIFNLIGPLLNPAQVKRQLIGLYDKKLLPIYAKLMQKLAYKKALLVNSKDGLDEISVCAETIVFDISPNSIKEYIINPKKYGIRLAQFSELTGKNVKYNAQRMLKLFNGQKDAYYDIVLLNSAFSLYVAGKYDIIEDALQEVERVLQEKQVIEILHQFKNFIK